MTVGAASETTARPLPEPRPDGSVAESPSGVEPPSWLRVVAFAPAAAVLTFGSTGLLLAVNGWYRPRIAYAVGGGAWIALLALARPAFSSWPTRHAGAVATRARTAHAYAALGVVAIVAITAWNINNNSEHVLIDRDGGSYMNTGRWIARDGSLAVRPRVGPFATDKSMGFGSIAVFDMPDGSLQFQFAHLLPVVLAEAYAVGGNVGMFHTPELLGGCALLAFFVLAWRLFRRPLFALSAMLALAFSIPQVSFSRDSYSEIPSQILLFTALWVLVSPRVLPRWRLALTAGLMIGALEATRLDAIVFLIGVPVVCLVACLRRAPADRRRAVLSVVALVAGIVPGLTLGFIDLMRHSGDYWNQLAPDVRALDRLALASFFVCLGVAAIWRFATPLRSRLPRKALANGAAAFVALVGFGAWAFRPRLQRFHGAGEAIVGLQRLEHVTVDATRMYWEWSLSWMAWYLGPLTIAVAIIGAALLARTLLLGGLTRVFAAVALLAPGSLVYLYQARAVPDHVWVTRRFLLGAIPLLVLMALGLASRMAAARSSSLRSRGCRFGAVVIAVAAVVYPIHTLLPIRAMAEETGYLGVVTDACATFGPRAAVVIVESARTDSIDDWAPQALRAWCGAEVGVIRGGAQPDDLLRLADGWTSLGRRFFVVASSSSYLRKLLPNATFTLTRRALDVKLLAPTLTHRPDAYGSESLQMVIASIPPR